MQNEDNINDPNQDRVDPSEDVDTITPGGEVDPSEDEPREDEGGKQ